MKQTTNDAIMQVLTLIMSIICFVIGIVNISEATEYFAIAMALVSVSLLFSRIQDQRDWSKFERFWDKTEMQKPTNNRMADGVYLIDCKGNAVRYDGKDTEALNDTAYIGIVQGSHSVAIALRDVSENEITLTSKKDDGKGHYIDSYMDAAQDWQGKQNTEHLQAVGLNPAIQLRDGEYIPTLAELYLICLNRKTINAAMRFAGGQELAGWYWSSTEYSAANAWNLYLDYGFAGNGFTEAAYTGRVRPVTTFEV